MARPSLDQIFASSQGQQRPSLDSIFAQQQQSPTPDQMAQQASQIPVNPGLGYGMNTMPSIQANSMLGPDANKGAIAANIELQKNRLNIGNQAQAAAAIQQATMPGNIEGKAKEQQAENIVEAQKSLARDSANVNMFAGVGRQLMDYYDDAYKNGLAGDRYRAGLGQAIVEGSVPRELSGMLPSSKPVGQFNAISNEWMTRMTPVMQEQFGKDGGSRIMDSMLKMAAKEVPGLNQPRDAVQGQLAATVKNMMRFTFGTADYRSRLGDNINIDKNTPQSTVDEVGRKLWNMSSVSPNKDIEKKANDIAAYITKDNGYQFAKNSQTGEVLIKGASDKSWRQLGQ